MGSILLDDSQGVVYTNAGSGTTVRSTVSTTGNVTVGGNLVVSGDLTGNKKNVISSGGTLSLTDSGAVVLLTGSAQTITLPEVATADGFNIKLHVAQAAAHVVTSSTGERALQGSIYSAGPADTLVRNALVNKSGFTLSTCQPGDMISIVGDGTNYHVHGLTTGSIAVRG